MVGDDPGSATATYDVVVLGGAGHVGLPLSLVFAASGLRVAILDTDRAALGRIGHGEMPFLEAGADQLLPEVIASGRLALSDDPTVLGLAEAVVVVIGTPIDEFLNPSMWVFDRVVDELAEHVRPGALVVLRSTVYPGTTVSVTRTLAERGVRVDVAFCPERIAEGHALEELRTLPQIVGAAEPTAGARAEALFGRLVPTVIHVSSMEAELAKLFTNAWRYVRFAAANQFFLIADAAGCSYDAILDAIRKDYPRAADLPGPGFAAGPCLLKDTMQIAAFTTDHFALGQAAMQVNEGIPAYLVQAMERRYGSLHGRTVGILGMAFKAESDDMRSSLSYKLRKLLRWTGARVICADPYVPDDTLTSLETVLAEAEILVIGAPHRAYRELDLSGRQVVDIWGATGAGVRV
jgi:UDP-N-acetyl-D-mannosaminuronic acid dehydrogenase